MEDMFQIFFKALVSGNPILIEQAITTIALMQEEKYDAEIVYPKDISYLIKTYSTNTITQLLLRHQSFTNILLELYLCRTTQDCYNLLLFNRGEISDDSLALDFINREYPFLLVGLRNNLLNVVKILINFVQDDYFYVNLYLYPPLITFMYETFGKINNNIIQDMFVSYFLNEIGEESITILLNYYPIHALPTKLLISLTFSLSTFFTFDEDVDNDFNIYFYRGIIDELMSRHDLEDELKWEIINSKNKKVLYGTINKMLKENYFPEYFGLIKIYILSTLQKNEI